MGLKNNHLKKTYGSLILCTMMEKYYNHNGRMDCQDDRIRRNGKTDKKKNKIQIYKNIQKIGNFLWTFVKSGKKRNGDIILRRKGG